MGSFKSTFCLAIFFSILVGISVNAHAAVEDNEIIYWNDKALGLVKKYNMPPPKVSRMLGLVHSSMFDAVNSIVREYKPYEIQFNTWSGKSPEQAAAHAAAYVLKTEFPDEETTIESWLEERAAGTDDSGAEAARYIIERHPLEFSNLEEKSIMQGYEWEPTPPQYAEYLLPKWCALKPLAIASAKDYRKSGPPAAGSVKFREAMSEAKLLGGKDSIVRTADQSEIAHFWADGKGTVTPPGHWNRIAADIILAKKMSLIDSARIMALLNLAMADAAIVAWDMKYVFSFSRPINLFGSEGWEPLIITPPFPEYVSGHSTFSGAAATVLAQTLGNVAFSTTSDALPNIKRNFDSFEAAAIEAGRSRIYGGIHFSFSDDDGRTSGSELARYVVANHLQKVGVVVNKTN